MALVSFPINTVPPTGDLITNTPSGVVTATTVQAAINQLASLIPVVGPGTDPLFLVHGFNISAFNPTFAPDPTNRYLALFSMNTDCRFSHPGFSNNATISLSMYGSHGAANFSALTSNKQTFFCTGMSGTFNASGQKFLYGGFLTSYGMSDTAIGQVNVTFAGGPVSGDEGQGFRLAQALNQDTNLNITTITSVITPSTVNTTTTQSITKSENAQTVTVVNTTGCNVGDWVMIDQELATAGQNLEAVKVLAVGPTTINAVFVNNHNSGATVLPATRIVVSSSFQMGQDRLLVNMSAPGYSTGTVTAIGHSIGGGPYTGSGTTWSVGMVGGNALNIGAIALAADDITSSPFSTGAGALRAWYAIIGVQSATSLSVFLTSVATDLTYRGYGPGSGGYNIQPAARIQRIMVDNNDSATGELILEYSTSPWHVGDTVQCIICPYPDVTGYQHYMNCYSPGGTYRAFSFVRNHGIQPFVSGYVVDSVAGGAWQSPSNPTGRDFGICYNASAVCNFSFYGQSGLRGGLAMTSQHGFGGPGGDNAGTIVWDDDPTVSPPGGHNSMFLGPDSNHNGMVIQTLLGSYYPKGRVNFVEPAGLDSRWNMPSMRYEGSIALPLNATGAGNPYSISIDNLAVNNTNYESLFMRWNANVARLGMEFGGTGVARDIAVLIGTNELLRFLSASKQIQYSNAASFSANAAVATVLGSLGPTGSHTTVQKWLTIVDNTGTTLYIPCF